MRLSDLDRRRLQFFVVGAAGLVLFMFTPFLEMGVGTNVAGIFGLVGAVAWVVLGTIALYRWFLFRCPSCGERFIYFVPTDAKKLFRNPYTNTCPECGYVLPKA